MSDSLLFRTFITKIKEMLKIIPIIMGFFVAIQGVIVTFLMLNKINSFSPVGSALQMIFWLLSSGVTGLSVLINSLSSKRGSWILSGFSLFSLLLAFDYSQYYLIPRLVPSNWVQYELILCICVGLGCVALEMRHELYKPRDRIKKGE